MWRRSMSYVSSDVVESAEFHSCECHSWLVHDSWWDPFIVQWLREGNEHSKNPVAIWNQLPRKTTLPMLITNQCTNGGSLCAMRALCTKFGQDHTQAA